MYFEDGRGLFVFVIGWAVILASTLGLVWLIAKGEGFI